MQRIGAGSAGDGGGEVIHITHWLRYLLHGSDELTMPDTWMQNRERLRAYENYTRRQLQQGAVVSDVETMARRDFWEHHAAKAKRVVKDNVTPIRRESQR